VTESHRATEGQAALRRVATLVARETAPDAVLAAVAEEVGAVLGVEATHLGRYDPAGTVVSVAQWGSHTGVPTGTRFPLEGDNVSVRVLQTGRPARMENYEAAHGVIADAIRQLGVRAAIGVPITVEGRTWGAPLPAEVESRLQRFTDLVAQGPAAGEVFDAVTTEVAGLLDASSVTLARHAEGELVVVATGGAAYVEVGDR
jgi:transcriptional regulator with GAF, ATPase, and Fis domain